MTQIQYTTHEIVERGKALYEQRIRPVIEINSGKFLVINVETGEYTLGDSHLAASDLAVARFPGAPLFAMRIGHATLGRIGHRASVKTS